MANPQIHLKHNGKPEKIKDKDGTDADGDSQGPIGAISNLEVYVYCTVDKPETGSECWVYHGGRWYKVC